MQNRSFNGGLNFFVLYPSISLRPGHCYNAQKIFVVTEGIFDSLCYYYLKNVTARIV